MVDRVVPVHAARRSRRRARAGSARPRSRRRGSGRSGRLRARWSGRRRPRGRGCGRGSRSSGVGGACPRAPRWRTPSGAGQVFGSSIGRQAGLVGLARRGERREVARREVGQEQRVLRRLGRRPVAVRAVRRQPVVEPGSVAGRHGLPKHPTLRAPGLAALSGEAGRRCVTARRDLPVRDRPERCSSCCRNRGRSRSRRSCCC